MFNSANAIFTIKIIDYQYAEKNNSNYIFKWFGEDKITTNWVEKFYHKTITQEIIREIQSFQPDIIHCHSIGAPVTPHFMEFAKSKGIPIVYSFRDYYYICPKNYMLNDKNEVIHQHESALECILHHQAKRNILFDTLLYFKQSHHKNIIKKYMDFFLTPSENLTQFVSNHFQKEGKTLPNPMLIEQNQNSKTEGNYILFVGRLVPEKGVLTLLKAFQNISKQFPNEQLWIVGEGNQSEELQNSGENNKLQNVLLLGNNSSEELQDIYANSKFSVVPSEYLEAYGNVIFESLAFGKTVITSDLVGIKNEVEQNRVGLTYSVKNQKVLEEKMMALLSNSGLKSELENNIPNY